MGTAVGFGSEEHVLERFQLLRYEANDKVSIVLTEGKAEIFGTELVVGKEIFFRPGDRGTVATFHGCKILAKGKGLDAYKANSSEDSDLIHVYMNIHANLQSLREDAQSTGSRGPRVLICGPESSGKSTLCRTLVNYATRRGAHPILVDLNVGLNKVCIPSTIAAVAVAKPYDFTEGWGLEEDPLVFSFGHYKSSENLSLYCEQVNHLAELVAIRCENDVKINSSGCVICMEGFVKTEDKGKAGLEAIRTAATAFEVDFIFVLEDGSLVNPLKDCLKDVTIIRLPRSAGARNLDPKQLTQERDMRIQSYFRGCNPSRKLHPYQIKLDSDAYKVYKIGSEMIPESLLPHGAEETEAWRSAQLLPVSRDILIHHLLAISQAVDESSLVTSPVFGFLTVTDVAPDRRSITVIAPSQQPPPSTLLMASVQYIDPETP